ncbi:ABC transporter permease [Oryzibacter oryziterrae]|uniref:ABC transporter permease n=1 Tax=Oryzibacter oryziterrae TaxID=2766474 RepID=UPI001F42031A|nr:ABC transporter permease [Oryzibacter oryziterrae]
MARFIFSRLAIGLVTLFVVSALFYLGTEMLPGDVATAILGQSATPANVAKLRLSLGLDQPSWLRFVNWLWGCLHGDLGKSLASGRPIATLLLPRLGNTLFLAACAALIAVPLALTLGILSALHEGKATDRASSALSLGIISMPEFLVGYGLIIVLSVHLGWLPSLGTVFPGMALGLRLKAMALPILTLTLVVLAHMLRMTRATILAEMAAPYVEMARLKGLDRRRIILAHILPNASGPIIAVVLLNLAYMVAGAVVVETVFVYPGIGQLLVDAVTKRDLPTVQACGLVFAIVYVGLNTGADVLALVFNPRLRHRR